MKALEFIAERLRRDIERDVASVGVLARVFARGKTERSLQKKLSRDPSRYSHHGRLVQDGVGVRVAVYFADDVAIVEDLLKTRYEYLPAASSIDAIDESTFNVLRRNLVFRLGEDGRDEMKRGGCALYPLDSTFEVQLRSMLSEGWHEVEHDLRYKCKAYWEGQSDLNRALNGVFATLETSEWSMLKIFDDLALRHYRSKQWAAMAHAKLRIRADPELHGDILAFLDEDAGAAKALFRVERKVLLQRLFASRISLPVNLSNFIYLWNHLSYQSPALAALAPSPVSDALSELA